MVERLVANQSAGVRFSLPAQTRMEKFAIEIETAAGWVTYHTIMRPGTEKGREVLNEVIAQYPNARFRLVEWNGRIIQ